MEDLLYTHVWQFVSEVNGVLRKHHGKVVETLQVKINLEHSILAPHIDTWVGFAAISRTKNLVLDLKPVRFLEHDYRYLFPFQLFDRESISRLQHMQLSFVSLDPPSQFKGFPNLRKLHLQTVQVNRKDLEDVLSNCCILEWLCLDRCRLDDELTVDSPLPRLLYLRVEFCLTKIRFNAVNLATFEYQGPFIPIDLVQSFKLQSANIEFFRNAIFQHRMLISLLNGLPSVQSLTLNVRSQHVDKILYSLSFLRATPLIEKLEVHFGIRCSSWLAEAGPSRRDLRKYKYVHLKHIWITGFRAAKGQLEFLLHLIENAPALEVLLVEIGVRQPPPKDNAGSSRNPREVLRAGPGYKNVIPTDLVDDTLLTAENLKTFKSTFKELYDFSMVRLE
ncbi:F-box/FBD/LRR-repeat protein At1g13570-like [Panicum hallii]|uniref:F-box/FBD/LRR-repeat protein At1g13570-like n=1 Tax=Panicum hallii TaxID=206008 RepID=UPI000DF4D7AB|nr:F-box/FBD/LRR-repeat protein At1g13570-like [Panicum hallii]